jgi:hypothetical protein
MKNKLTDLNDHLFAQLERLGDEDLKGDALLEEIGRAKAITNVAQQIVNNGNLSLNVIRVQSELLPDKKTLPEIFSGFGAEPTEKNSQKKIPDNLRSEFERN